MKSIVLTVLFFSIITKAQNFVIPLWSSNMPNYQEVEEEEILKNASSTEHYKLVTKPDISVFLPSNNNRTGQAVLVIPGGGYQAIVHIWEGEDIAKWLNSNGIVAIVLKYRLPNAKNNIVSHKSPLLDASRAMKIIKDNAEEWHIDKNNIGVMGFSAGGHLASTLGTHYDKDENRQFDKIDSISSRPDFMVLMYPVITMDVRFTHMGSRNNLLGENPSPELVDYYSNEKQVSETTPPTMIFHCTDDAVVPVENSTAFYKALQEKNIDSEMHIFQHGKHGFALANGKGHLELWKSLCKDWLRNYNQQ
jgi:acetyl esterase/lipase